MDYIKPSSEFLRIKNLPRRRFDPTNKRLLGMVDMMTTWLKTPEGTEKLLPIQAFVLEEFHNYKGFIGAIPVGIGKTHIFALAPTVVPCERPLGIVPVKHLKEKTPRHLEKIKKHWKVRDDITLTSYEKIGVKSGKNLLFDLNPDLIMCDELQYLKNRKNSSNKVARTTRFEKYVRAKRPKIIGLSGTFMDRSMTQGWHIMYYIMPYTMPLPRKWWEFNRWKQAVEDDPMFTGIYPGVLTEFCNLDEDLTDGIGRRIVETPGIISLENDDVKCSLTIEALWPDIPDEISTAVAEMRETMETPGGEPFELAISLWRHARELGCGYYNTFKDPPPTKWIWKRREWAKVAREILRYSRTYETEYEFKCDILEGKFQLQSYQQKAWDDWAAIEKTFTPVTVPVWISDYLVKYCQLWLEENERGLLWCELKPFAERLSEKTGIPYFCHLGKSKEGIYIEDFEGPAIVSPIALRDGYNLQYKWNKNLLVSYKPNNEDMEQLLGRTHRQFQTSDEVWAGFVFTVDETVKGFEKMIEEAKKYKTIHTSKLLYADYINIDIDAPIIRR